MSYVVTGVCELFGVVWLFIPREFSICMLYVGTILWNFFFFNIWGEQVMMRKTLEGRSPTNLLQCHAGLGPNISTVPRG